MKKAVLVLVIVLGGCVSSYQQAKLSAPHATVSFFKGYDIGLGFRTSTAQEYSIVTNGACKKAKRISFFTWITGEATEKRVVPDKPISVLAYTSRLETTSVSGTGYGYVGNMSEDRCQNMSTFTPVSGGRYSIVQKAVVGESCRLEVIDLATGLPPKDLQMLPVPFCTDE